MAPMGRFHWITILVAVVVLVIVLIYVGILMTKGNKASKAFPPLANTCPDYWLTDISNSCVIPVSGSKNAPKISLSSIKTSDGYTPGYNGTSVDFNSASWVSSGKSAVCNKLTWCRKLGVYWDGIDNYNNCETTTTK